MAEHTTPAPAPPPKRLRFMDYLGIFFGITTVVGFVLAFYWHAQSVQERDPTYYVSQQRTRILDTSIPAPSQLQVLYKGKDLNANISAVIVYVWNDGKLAIKAEDVLEPLRIQLAPGSGILDTRLLRVSRAVTRFAKGEVSDAAKNSLPISFSILERGDGAALQIIYTGNPDAAVSLQGTILGVAETHNLSRTEAAATRPPLERRDGYYGIMLWLCDVRHCCRLHRRQSVHGTASVIARRVPVGATLVVETHPISLLHHGNPLRRSFRHRGNGPGPQDAPLGTAASAALHLDRKVKSAGCPTLRGSRRVETPDRTTPSPT
jgi:hypothetical protein